MDRMIDVDMIMREFGLNKDCNFCIRNKRDCQYNQIYTRLDLCDFVRRAAYDGEMNE